MVGANILSIYPLPGISYTHDANACLVNDERVLYAAEEERFLRSQHAIGHVPERAAMLGFRQCHLDPASVDRLVVTSMERCARRPDYRARLQFLCEQLHVSAAVPVTCVPHHLAHSALAVLTSPFDECLFLSLDGGGDFRMGHWGVFRDRRFRIVETFALSPAIFFSFVTTLCGFPLFEEGKAMGLAAYGHTNDQLLSWFKRWFRIRKGGASLETELALKWHSAVEPPLVDPDSFPRHKYFRWALDFVGDGDHSWIDEIPPADIARTGQQVFEDLLAEIAETLTARTGLRHLACAGGAFLNVKANSALLSGSTCQAVHIPGAPHDAGLSLGAALWTRHILGQPRLCPPISPLLGPDFTEDEVARVLQSFDLPFERPIDLPVVVARAIADGQVVGWFDGRAEYGARALGARSVLADPRAPDARARLNQLLKRRDWFMPFAPSILEEYAGEYLIDATPNPYMNVAWRVRPDQAAAIQSALHVDGTCRAHIVSKQLNPRYHAVISAFHALTGVPLVLNTSFNRHGLPMVATPRHAVQHLLEGCVDLLVLNGFIVEGRRATTAHQPADEKHLLRLMSVCRAARLARAGRFGNANRLLSHAGVAITATPNGLTHRGATVWAYTMPLEQLERWWLEEACD